MARARKSIGELRSQRLMLNFTTAELAELEDQARMAGGQLSRFVRELALRGRVVVRRAQTDDRLLAVLTRIGVNLNQLTRHAQGQDGLSAPIAGQLRALLTRIDALTDRIYHDR